MNLNFLCCIGAELKNSTHQTTRMTQIYLYRAYESETVDDMLAPGFFDAAMGIIRKDDLLLLYGPNDEKARYVYARVSEIDRDGVVIEKVEDVNDIYVDTDDMSNLHAHTLQDVITEIDAEITRLDDRIDEEIARAKAAEGNLTLPVITDGATAPTNLSEAVRQLNTQNITTITADNQAPTPGKWTLWAAIKKCFANIVNFFAELTVVNSRLNALEGRGGPVGARDFGKTFTNPITGADAQEILTAMVDDIWPGHTAITWNDPLSSSSFTDADGVNRTVAEIFNATWIRNSYDGTRIVLANTPDTIPPVFSLQNVGVDVVGYANETTAGIVRVGSGSQMVVNPTTGDISLNGAKAAAIRSTIDAPGLSAENEYTDNAIYSLQKGIILQGANGEKYTIRTDGSSPSGFIIYEGESSANTIFSYQPSDQNTITIGISSYRIKAGSSAPLTSNDKTVATTEWVRDIITEQMGGDFVQYWDSGDATDHSHAKPGVATPASGAWYRLYKSGWVEQGGRYTSQPGAINITLPIEMIDTDYFISVTPYTPFANLGAYVSGYNNPTTTSFGLAGISSRNDNAGKWQVTGMSAQ